MTLLKGLKLKGPLTHPIRGSMADHLADLVFFIAGFDCFVERLPVFVLFEFGWAEGFPIRGAFPRERPFMLHTLAEDMESDEGMGFDIDREEFSILSGAREIGDNESLGAALVALDECHSRWRDVDIEGFFVGVLEIRSVVAEELTRGETEASSPGDFERGEAVDVRRGHRLFARINLIRYFQTRRPVGILMKAIV